MARRIQFLLAKEGDLGVTEQVDFALAFWMVHEVTDVRKFFLQIYSILKPAGIFLIAEPKMHVTQAQFDATLLLAAETGFQINAAPVVRLSRAVVCKK